MRDFKYLLGMVIVALVCFTADAATNPDPFNKARAAVPNVEGSQTAVVPSVVPVPAPAPQIVVAAPAPGWSFDNILNTINTLVMTILAAFIGKGVLKPTPTQIIPVGEVAADPLSALVAKAKDPKVTAILDGLISRAADSELVRSGVRTGISAGLGLVPGAGGLLAGSPLPASIETLINATAKKVAAEMHAQAPVAS